MRGNKRIFILNKTDKALSYNGSTVGQHILNNWNLNQELYDQLTNQGILNLNTKGEINNRIINSLYWFGLGLESKHPSTQLINFIRF